MPSPQTHHHHPNVVSKRVSLRKIWKDNSCNAEIDGPFFIKGLPCVRLVAVVCILYVTFLFHISGILLCKEIIIIVIGS